MQDQAQQLQEDEESRNPEDEANVDEKMIKSLKHETEI